LGIGPNPKSPIPNPQSPLYFSKKINIVNNFIKFFIINNN